MVKVKILARFGRSLGRKFEKGLVYSLPPDYAEELIKHGLAESVEAENIPAPAVIEVKAEVIPEPKPEPEPEPVVIPRRKGKK